VLEARRAERHYASLALRLREALCDRAWDPERGVYVDGIDPASGRQYRRVSQHSNAAMILWGDAPRARWDSMIHWITDPARLVFTAAPPIVPVGGDLNEEHDVVLANTFYSHFVYRALCAADRFDLALSLIRERYGRMLERGATTLWESFEPTASLCHGFSTTPLYQLSTEVLGVYPLAPGFARFRLASKPGDLLFARGVFPTVHGDISVSWERSGTTISLRVDVPDGVEGVIEAPVGYRLADGAARVCKGRHTAQYVSGA
jgi:hypothetical protein